LSATILEVIQGPCEGNQAHFALNTELIETLNRVMRAKVVNDCVEEEEIELKKTAVDIFQGLLEGQGEKSVVYERLLSVIHLDVIQLTSIKNNESFVIEDEVRNTKKDLFDEKKILQTECFVLLQMLCDFKPTLNDEIGIDRNANSEAACIEIIWRGSIHRRFFHVPKVCEFLAKSSKDALVEFVDRSNAENKLIDFLNRSHDLFREVKHQQLLNEEKIFNINLSQIFSRENLDRTTWITFIVTLIINVLFLVYYDTDSNKNHTLPSQIVLIIHFLNYLQSVMAFCNLIFFLVVRSPVNYQTIKAAGYDTFNAILFTATDAMTMYYFFYLVISLLGLYVADYYISLLLLDIVVKISTLRDLLNAVLIPRKILAMTGLLALFANYIFAYFIVSIIFYLFFYFLFLYFLFLYFFYHFFYFHFFIPIKK
jgi:hypothetical protein